MKTKCIVCDSDLIQGEFAFNQEMCWDCVIFETKTMLEQIEDYPNVLGAKKELHGDILKWLILIAAERFGLPRPTQE